MKTERVFSFPVVLRFMCVYLFVQEQGTACSS